MPGIVLNSQADPKLAKLAGAITGSWAEISSVWDEFRLKYGYLLRADTDETRNAFLRQAIWMAYGDAKLDALLARLAAQNLIDPQLPALLAAEGATGFHFQSYVNGVWQSQDALVAGRRLMQACDHVCRISIDGKHRGTGILIRPLIVATAAHVIAPLVDPNGRRLPDGLGRLVLSFVDADSLMANGAANATVLAELDDDWLIDFSPPARGESTPGYPVDCADGIGEQNGPWDVALIQLAEPPRVGLAGVKLADTLPNVQFGVHVLHHPANALGQAMQLLWSIGDVTKALGTARPLRWLHSANTDSGSSGAPCFDNNWQVVALHQGGSTNITAKNQLNRAVPVYRWAEQLDALASRLGKTPYVTFVNTLKGERPVFGRRDLQDRLWQAMTDASAEGTGVFVVEGAPMSGKSFTASIVSSLGEQAGCRVAVVDARNLPGDIVEDARAIAGAFAVSIPDHALANGGVTSEFRDAKKDVAPALLDTVMTQDGGKSSWLVVDGLSDVDPGSPTGQLIEAILIAVRNRKRLNLVLIDWRGAVQAQFIETLATVPTTREISEQLWLSLAPSGAHASAATIATVDEVVVEALNAAAPGNPFERAADAARQATVTVRAVVKVVAKAIGNG